jgi:TetR/AcrR family transcriptional regulator
LICNRKKKVANNLHPPKFTKAEAAEISKKAILDAAEALFAARGFEATSLQDICDLAGVARGTPGYFFGSKEQLYRAVLERTFAQSQSVATFIRERQAHPDTDPKESLKVVIEKLFDFFVTHPNFIRITEWEGLNGGQYLGNLPIQIKTFKEAIQLLQKEMGWNENAEQFLIDLVALCWFPLAHAQTFLKPLGLDAYDPEFVKRRKQHVIETLLGK